MSDPPSDPPPRRPHWGPPWMHGHSDWTHHRRAGKNGRTLFLRFGAVFGLFTLLLVGWFGALAFLVARFMDGRGHPAAIVWFTGCTLLLFLPMLAGAVARYGFRRFAMPMAGVMHAAEAVTRGDLSARAPVSERGDFAPLAHTFNRMVAELERADRQRRNLTADIAHELRTPLHVIQGNLEGILDGVYEPTTEHITATLGETRLLARLVEDLRLLSLAETNQLSLAREKVDIGDTLQDVATGFSGQAESSSVTLRVSLPDGAPLVVVGDAARLDQIVSNLVANALRHTPVGGTVTLGAAHATTDGAPVLRITVADTGEGIPPDLLPYIFDRFWRGDPARTRANGTGSGLGLAIARQLVQAHGGTIEAASTPGAGTTFTIELPAPPGN